MTSLNYARLLVRFRLVLAAAGLLGALLGEVSYLLATPQYRASAEVFVGVDLRGEQDYAASLYTLERMQSYRQLAESPEVIQTVADRFTPRLNASQLRDALSASVLPQTVLIRLDVQDTDAQRSADIANAVAESLSAAILAVESSPGRRSLIRVTTTRTAVPPLQAASPDRSLYLGLGLTVGLGLGLTGLSMSQRVDNSALFTPSSQNAEGSLPAAPRAPQ